MGDFLKTVVQTLREEGAGFTIRESGAQDRPVYVDLRKQEPWTPNLVYVGEGGPTCPDCDVPAGEKHREGCVFLRPPRLRWDADCAQGNTVVTDVAPEVEQGPVTAPVTRPGAPNSQGGKHG